jgi:glycosyltransferase involved in cell wall biosynthesis
MADRPEENTSTVLREKYGLPGEYGLFLGNTDPKKNTRDTLRAWQIACKKMKREIPLVIGDVDQQEAKSRMRFSDADLQTMRFPGYIENKDLPAVMAEAKIFLYTSRRESFGIPILEAMASGTPVVTSNVTSMPEVAGDAAYLVDPYDLNSMDDVFQRVLEDEVLAKDLIQKGLERVQSFRKRSPIRCSWITLWINFVLFSSQMDPQTAACRSSKRRKG